jgi:hypothetical protein
MKPRTAVILIGAVLALAWADWTFSFGPLTSIAVSRCTSQLEGTEDTGLKNAQGQSIRITTSHDDAREKCEARKRQGALTLSGGIRL